MPPGMMGALPGAPTKAFASGVRSSTFKLDGQWYRLKGNGNNDEGFVVKARPSRIFRLALCKAHS